MPTVPLKLLTVVAEGVLANRLTRAILDAGALGYTLSAAKGIGARNRRSSSLGGDNVRIEVLAPESIAMAVLQMLVADWFPHYAVVAWITDVAVVRGEKYASESAGRA